MDGVPTRRSDGNDVVNPNQKAAACCLGIGGSHSESLIMDYLKRNRIDSQSDVVRDRHRGSHKRLRGTDCFQISLIGKQYNTALFEKQENADTNVSEQKRRKEGRSCKG